jgi:hypothetical protein
MVITILKKGKSSVVLAVAATLDIMFKIVRRYTVENVESFGICLAFAVPRRTIKIKDKVMIN